MNLNKVMLIGRLTRDPEIRTTPSGQTVTRIGLATNHVYNDKSGQKQERTDFHNLVLWGRTAEIAGQYLTKGQEAYFEGRLTYGTFTGKDGVERKTTDIVVETMQLGSRAQGSSMSRGQQTARPAQQAGSWQKSPAAVAPAVAPSARQDEERIPSINLDDEKDDIRIEDVPF